MPFRYEILDKIERRITFMENVRNRSTPRKYMRSMREYMDKVETRQYTQDGRRVLTTSGLY